ncbi:MULTISPECIES: hypothetical protein [unclassified Bradyrhizobium]|uniref:hypothetical protein n=1 Tax=unclassified Bradyrhizobium TaxID=2631580 RepID=UPI001FF76BDE|nr:MULTISPECIES: hypothetical protein [unclassified Bradyrhizobium]MCK1536899.1 hypothetical protein [Bradyrhizobium sp. 176]MCK1560202.1 hypothetical protein [Bradyrhizobium sp. 171]
MTAMLTTILGLISALVPAGTNAALIEKIVEALIAIVPVVVKEYQDLVPIVRNIIGALKADPSTTAAQLAQLQQLEVQWDADFEAAAAAAIAEDGGS